MQEILNKLPKFKAGSVWLVGAGPGDPGLLSLLALKALREADVIVYDALVDPSILELASPQVYRQFAGKRGGKPSAKQPDISQSLIRYAKEGKKVLRLKGGDPFVFGRGGEEALALAGAGVSFRIVPGITSGIGGLAYAGIPLTHRQCNSTVAFVTGHDANGEVPNQLDWNALAKAAPVLVFYMAIKHMAVIRQNLLKAGRLPEEAMAFITKATTIDQKVVVTTLGDCLNVMTEQHIEPPAIVVLGETVKLRSLLHWLEETRQVQFAG